MKSKWGSGDGTIDFVLREYADVPCQSGSKQKKLHTGIISASWRPSEQLSGTHDDSGMLRGL